MQLIVVTKRNMCRTTKIPHPSPSLLPKHYRCQRTLESPTICCSAIESCLLCTSYLVSYQSRILVCRRNLYQSRCDVVWQFSNSRLLVRASDHTMHVQKPKIPLASIQDTTECLMFSILLNNTIGQDTVAYKSSYVRHCLHRTSIDDSCILIDNKKHFWFCPPHYFIHSITDISLLHCYLSP